MLPGDHSLARCPLLRSAPLRLPAPFLPVQVMVHDVSGDVSSELAIKSLAAGT